jgi:hypothetical protein
VFLARHDEQLLRVTQTSTHAVQRKHDRFKQFLFFTQVLGTLRIVPDIRILDQAVNFDKSIVLVIEVKDTSEVPGSVVSDPLFWLRSR